MILGIEITFILKYIVFECFKLITRYNAIICKAKNKTLSIHIE